MIVAAVALAGALGAVLRHLVDHLVQHRLLPRRHRSEFPVGITVVNLTGSFALGLVVGLGLHSGLSVACLTVVGTGLIGSYTTFSTFTFDTARLAEDGRWAVSMLNVVISLASGLGGAAAGLAFGAVV